MKITLTKTEILSLLRTHLKHTHITDVTIVDDLKPEGHQWGTFEGWANLYRDGHTGGIFKTKHAAEAKKWDPKARTIFVREVVQ